MSARQVEFWTKLRDASQMVADAANDFLKSMAPPELGLGNEPAAVTEATFSLLKWDAQKGAQLGDFDLASKAGNLEGKWLQAFNILRNSNATIKDRYYGAGYNYSYWIYGQDKIYRQRLRQPSINPHETGLPNAKNIESGLNRKGGQG